MAINHMFIIICVSYQYMGGDKKSITKGENQKGASDISPNFTGEQKQNFTIV